MNDDEEIKQIFIEESHQYLDKFEEGVSRLVEGRPAPEEIANIVRYGHSLKGMAATMELPEIQSIAALLESSFKRVHDGELTMDRAQYGEVLKSIEAIRTLVRDYEDERPPSHDSESILRSLKEMLGKKARGKALVLLVEDTATISKMVAFRLKKTGYDVVAAEDGKTALKTLEETQPDIILLDHGLPDMDGVEVCRIVKADDRYASVPVILFTAITHEGDLLEQSGADDIVLKPYEPRELIEKIERHLGKGS